MGCHLLSLHGLESLIRVLSQFPGGAKREKTTQFFKCRPRGPSWETHIKSKWQPLTDSRLLRRQAIHGRSSLGSAANTDKRGHEEDGRRFRRVSRPAPFVRESVPLVPLCSQTSPASSSIPAPRILTSVTDCCSSPAKPSRRCRHHPHHATPFPPKHGLRTAPLRRRTDSLMLPSLNGATALSSTSAHHQQ